MRTPQAIFPSSSSYVNIAKPMITFNNYIIATTPWSYTEPSESDPHLIKINFNFKSKQISKTTN